MEVGDGREDLSCVKLCYLLFKDTFFEQMLIQVTSFDIFHEEVDTGITLKHIVQTHYKRVLALISKYRSGNITVFKISFSM